MSDLPAEPGVRQSERMRDFIRSSYDDGLPPQYIEYLIALTEHEQAQFMAGDDAVWLAKATPDRSQRLEASLTQVVTKGEQLMAEEWSGARATDPGNHAPGHNGHLW